jgi:HlyD family secretion protein
MSDFAREIVGSPTLCPETPRSGFCRRPLVWFLLGMVLSATGTAGPVMLLCPAAKAEQGHSPINSRDSQAAAGAFEVPGKTQPVPGKLAIIAPTVLHPVEEVRVVPGDRVKKGQPLVKLDDDEPRADVRAKTAALAEMKASLDKLKAQPRKEEQDEARAALASAQESARETRRIVRRMTPAHKRGAISDATMNAALSAMRKAETDERAAAARLQQLLKKPIKLEIAEAEAKVANARAALDAAKAELEHYLVTAPIAGVVTWLEVNPGMVSRPGTTVWGEILDLSESDVRCDLTAEQADRVAVGQAALVRQARRAREWTGRVVSVGLAADRRTGRVPAVVRIKDARERLRCHVEVTVRFAAQKGQGIGD